MLFLPNNAVVHQGSYALPIALFTLLSAWIDLAYKWAIAAFLALQGASFLVTYAVAGDQVGGKANDLSIAIAVLAAFSLLVVIIREKMIGDSNLVDSMNA